ncbi:MAG: hypothetical protein DWQ02_09130 [Bacteroidetes bacterium]|nr:MAG: hypothetical protein DWQ02_09130 [Bacteroidota bacterium]
MKKLKKHLKHFVSFETKFLFCPYTKIVEVKTIVYIVSVLSHVFRLPLKTSSLTLDILGNTGNKH